MVVDDTATDLEGSGACTISQDALTFKNWRATPTHLGYQGGLLTCAVDVEGPFLSPSVTCTVSSDVSELPKEALVPLNGSATWQASVPIPVNFATATRTYTVLFRVPGPPGGVPLTVTRTVTQDAYRLPELKNCRATPSPLSGDGGPLTCAAEVTLPRGPASGTGVLVKLLDGEHEITTVDAVKASGTTYQAVIPVPRNPAARPRTLTVRFLAPDPTFPTLSVSADCRVVQEGVPVPKISNVKITPTRLGRNGGTVRAQAKVTAAHRVALVQLQIIEDGRQKYAALLKRTGSVYKGKVKIPGRGQGRARRMTTVILATDKAGLTARVNGPDITQAGAPR